MNNDVIVLQPSDGDEPGDIYAGPGLVWSSGDNRGRQQSAKERGKNRPGSIYYPGAPPDEDDPWQWCMMCECWHPHGPCF